MQFQLGWCCLDPGLVFWTVPLTGRQEGWGHTSLTHPETETQKVARKENTGLESRNSLPWGPLGMGVGR